MITLQQVTEAKKLIKDYEAQQSKLLHWKVLVDVWFEWYSIQRIGKKPDFTGSAPKDLKSIIEKVKNKCDANDYEWNEENAKKALNHFFNLALAYKFTSDKLLLSLFNKYFQEITDGQQTTNNRKSATASSLQSTLQSFAQDYLQR